LLIKGYFSFKLLSENIRTVLIFYTNVESVIEYH